jgi:hypothetical protein
MKATKTIRIDADTVAAVAEWGREHGDISTSDAANILLASALGRHKAARLNKAERDTAKDHGPNGGDGELQAVAIVPSAVAPPTAAEPMRMPNADEEATIADVVSRLWGTWPIETEIFEAAGVEFILYDPPTAVSRYRALIAEGEHLGHKRQSNSMMAFLLARLSGQPGGIGPWGPQPPR